MPPRSAESSSRPARRKRREGRVRRDAEEGEGALKVVKASHDAAKPKRRRKKGDGDSGGKDSRGNSASAGKRRSKKGAGSSGRSGSRAASRGKREFHGPSLFDALTRRNAILLWLGGFLFWAALLIYPVADGATRSLSALLALALPLGLLGLWWRYALLRWGLILVYGLLVSYWFLPGRVTFDRPALREETARALLRYEGVRVWPDGENLLGVDGAGLVRRSVIEASFIHGLRTLNPWLLRRALTFWWNDLSARDLVPSAKGSARRYTVAKSLHELNPAVLYPGDFVVTEDRQYVFAYLGDQRWLLPDPQSRRVIVVDTAKRRVSGHPAAEMSVSLMRWRILEAPRVNSVYFP